MTKPVVARHTMLTIDACGIVLAVDANPSTLVTTLGVETPSTRFNLRVKVALVRVTETLTPLKIRKKTLGLLPFPIF